MKPQSWKAFKVRVAMLVIVALLLAPAVPAVAEPTEITVAKEYGIGYLP
jgi:hypothetical protein